MKKLTKLEICLIFIFLFFIFVYIGFKKKFGVDIVTDFLEKTGIKDKPTLVDSFKTIFDLFLIGIGIKK